MLACEGEFNYSTGNGEKYPISRGIIIDFKSGIIHSFGGYRLTIDEVDETQVGFHVDYGSGFITGTLSRITGKLAAMDVPEVANEGGRANTTYVLHCTKKERMF